MLNRKESRARWRRYSLRFFLVTISLFGVLLALCVNRVHRQRKVVAWVERIGGHVEYSDRAANAPSGPRWLRKLFGDDLFVTVHTIHLPDVNEKDLAAIEGLDTVQLIYVSPSAKASAAGLAALTKFENVRGISLGNTSVTDEGVKHLVGFAKLELLDLSETQVSDLALPTLGQLTHLELLDLSHTTVTDEGLNHLANLTDLEELRLNSTNVTDEKINELRSRMPAAEVLCGESPSRLDRLVERGYFFQKRYHIPLESFGFVTVSEAHEFGIEGLTTSVERRLFDMLGERRIRQEMSPVWRTFQFDRKIRQEMSLVWRTFQFDWSPDNAGIDVVVYDIVDREPAYDEFFEGVIEEARSIDERVKAASEEAVER